LNAQTVVAFDLGEARVGVAVGNTLLREATPLSILPAQPKERLFAAIAEVLSTWQANLLVVGVARHASGAASPMTARCERFANQLAGRFNLPVARIDERYSSVDADALQRESRQAGGRAKKQLDDLAAAVILKRYFDESESTAA
jgi:putative Holliday junction resolvase